MAQDDLTNMVQTLGFVTPNGKAVGLTDAYQQVCDFAFQKVATGAQDYNSAIRQATKALADKGIVTINYESGVHTSLEAAVRRNVMGGLGLMQEQISQYNHDALGCDGWEISAHAASAPDHEPIQGKQYSDAQYTALNNSLVRRIGTLNCGHAAFPIILGVNSPQYSAAELEKFRRDNEKGIEYEGRHFTTYEATQRQRQLERAMRKQKRRILVDEKLGDKEQLAAEQTKLVRLKDEYARFTKAAKLRSQIDRANISGFAPKQGRAAEKIYKSISEKSVAKSSNGGTIKSKLTDTDTRAIQDYMSTKSYVVNEKLRTGAQLTAEERGFVNNLDAALKKMPAYHGNLQRSLFFDSAEEEYEFLQIHTAGSKVNYTQYISTTRGSVYNAEGQIQILIKNSQRGRDISFMNPNELEVLYERGSSFVVTNTVPIGGKHYIFMEENDE